MKKMLTTAAVAILAGLAGFAADPIIRDFWSAEAIDWGDGRPYEKEPQKGDKHFPQGFKARYDLEIKEGGWYELLGRFNPHDLRVDGKLVWSRRASSPIAKGGKQSKAGNLWLEAGKHTLSFECVGRPAFPVWQFTEFTLSKADGAPEKCVTADKSAVDVVRSGENLEILVTGGGGGQAAAYEIFSKSVASGDLVARRVGEVAFDASEKPVTKKLLVPGKEEGGFLISAKVKDGKDLLPCEFPFGEYAVIDTRSCNPGGGALETVCVIDCAKQTLNGAPLAADAFVEAHGPTRVVTTAAGTYRESHDATPPAAPGIGAGGQFSPKNASGFSYVFPVPKIGVPYLIDIEYPDDTRRAFSVMGFGGYGRGGGKSAETGGNYRISNTMKHMTIVCWPTKEVVVDGKMRLSMFAGQYLTRCAASKITVSRWKDDLVPAAKVAKQGGRQYTLWWEEGGTWLQIVGDEKELSGNTIGMINAVDRYARLARFHGATGVSLPATSYQGAMFRTDRLPGFSIPKIDEIRLIALTCEKYGMGFISETFPAQWYMIKALKQSVANPDEITPWDCYGAGAGALGTNTLNALHPAVQKFWIDAFKELGDKLRDSPAFLGLVCRTDAWQFRGDYILTNLRRGYGDWTVGEFVKDSGIKVPGEAGDPMRFMRRYEFLTSPAMKERWLAWRCERILNYHKAIRDALRGGVRDDIFFGCGGDFCRDRENLTIAEAARNCGVDLKTYSATDGLTLIPHIRYGTDAEDVAAKEMTDDMESPDYVEFGMGSPRAFAMYFNYIEYGKNIPFQQLGYTGEAPFHYTAACNASGRDALEKFAVVMAQQDTGWMRDGGDDDPFGELDAYRRWFGEFSSLPMLPFQKVPTSADPAAVWQLSLTKPYKDFTPGLYFYAVNREQYPVELCLSLTAKEVVSLFGGEKTAVDNGKLSIALPPYALLAFRAEDGAAVTSAAVKVPETEILRVRNLLSQAQAVDRELSDGAASAFTADEFAAFKKTLGEAWDAFQQGHYWRARTALGMGKMRQVYTKLGKMPDGMRHTQFPDMLSLVKSSKGAHWQFVWPLHNAEELTALAGTLVPSTEFNPDWHSFTVLRSRNGALEVELDTPAEGSYTLELGLVAKKRGVIAVSLDGAALPVAVMPKKAGNPETFSCAGIKLMPGKKRLSLRHDGDFGLYALSCRPQIREVKGKDVSTMGEFNRLMAPGAIRIENLKKGENFHALDIPMSMSYKFYPEEGKVDWNAEYDNGFGQKVRWRKPYGPAGEELIVDMLQRSGGFVPHAVNYAVTHITSDRERTAVVSIGGDWEVEAWLNGAPLKALIPNPMSNFGSWNVLPNGVLNLRKGVNMLFLKQRNGSMGSGVCLYITDDPGIVCHSTDTK